MLNKKIIANVKKKGTFYIYQPYFLLTWLLQSLKDAGRNL